MGLLDLFEKAVNKLSEYEPQLEKYMQLAQERVEMIERSKKDKADLSDRELVEIAKNEKNEIDRKAALEVLKDRGYRLDEDNIWRKHSDPE